jgi:hypothetical protein
VVWSTKVNSRWPAASALSGMSAMIETVPLGQAAARIAGENEAALQRVVAQDFKTASQERIFESLACLGEVVV